MSCLLAAHFAGATKDAPNAVAASLAAFEAEEAANQPNEAILSSTTTTYASSLLTLRLLTLAWRSTHSAHLHGSLWLLKGRFCGSRHGGIHCRSRERRSGAVNR